MQNAPREPVYNDPELGPIYDDDIHDLYLDRHPDRVHEYLYGEGFVPLAEGPFFFEAPLPGQVLLARPMPVEDDRFWARVDERNTNWIRLQSQNLLLAGDGRTRNEQECQFSVFTRHLLLQRGFGRFCADPFEWSRRFSNREVVETTEHLYRRHGDVRLRIDLATEEFDLCGPNMRVRQCSDDINLSLRPVVDALWLHGLWAESTDERFQDIARVLVRLAAAEQRELGCGEFNSRYGSGR